MVNNTFEEIWSSFDPWEGIPDDFNVGKYLTDDQVEEGHGDTTALLWENSLGDKRSFTYEDFRVLTNRFGNALIGLGIERGDRILLRLPNLPEFYVAALGANKIGAVYIPTSTLFREKEIAYRLNDSGAVAVVTTPQLVEQVENVKKDCPSLKHIIIVPYMGDEASGNQLNFNNLLDQAEDNLEIANTKNDDDAFICYTSGTTGDPKGCVHMHRYPLAFNSLIQYWYRYQPGDIAACPPEIAWKFPLASTFLYAFCHGVSVVLYHQVEGGFSPENWFRLIQDYGITCFVGTPTIHRMMLTVEDAEKRYDLSKWKRAVSAGESLPADTYQSVKSRFGVEVLDGIGMSESMVYCFNMIGQPVMPGSTGRPAPGTVIKVLDEKLNEVETGTPGVLCVRRDTHAGIMKGYWNKPEKTAEILRGDWYYSGDVYVMDEDNYFWFKGRDDDLMKCSGYRISPFEVESVLLTHPTILEAAAVQSPDEIRGHVVKAFIVLREGVEASDTLVEQIQEHSKQNAAPYKYPRKVEFVESLPKTQSGKIKRRLLRDRELEITR